MKKNVYIAYTGGTIGMQKTSKGYAPAPGLLSHLMVRIPELQHETMPSYEINEYTPLLDSSNMGPGDWLKIARDIEKQYDRFDGFVVLHGTDTMTYTASALSFMLNGLNKPVIITGAQIPLCEIRNDARENLITAIMIAANFHIPEVCLCFGNKLLRGNRAVKVNADGFDAFESPNFPILGTVGIDIDIHRNLLLPSPEDGASVKVDAPDESKVAAIRLFPGISKEIIGHLVEASIRGIVLETYGKGNAPEKDDGFLAALNHAARQGVVIINCTQCLKGTVDMKDYTTGSVLAGAGVVSGFDMTVETALAKMVCLFGRENSVDVIKTLMQNNLRGELSLPLMGRNNKKN
jgi:L-asparaginase